MAVFSVHEAKTQLSHSIDRTGCGQDRPSRIAGDRSILAFLYSTLRSAFSVASVRWMS